MADCHECGFEFDSAECCVHDPPRYATVYADERHIGWRPWVRRYDYTKCDAESMAHQRVMTLRGHGYRRAVWIEEYTR